MLLNELAGRHEISLVALVWNDEDEAALDEWARRGIDVYPIPHGIGKRVRALVGGPGRPLQEIASTSPLLARQVRELIARQAGRGLSFDAVHVEHLRGASALRLTEPLGVRTVLDAVDCIAELARLARTHGSNITVRTLGRFEERRTRRLERTFVDAADVVTVVAERDRLALAGNRPTDRIEVVPNGVAALPRPVSLTDSPLAIFTGKLSYHANQAALRLLLDDIWPRVRSDVPDARLVVAGAEPPGWLQRRGASAGVTVVANPADLVPLVRQARVALAPMVYSVGVQNKILEAMACGVPVVATPIAADGLLPAAEGSLLLAGDSGSFSAAVTRVLRDTLLAESLGRSGYDYVTSWHSWDNAARRFEDLYAGLGSMRLVA
jgi:glycosyltransferase involved in cell wall biosynthesis